MRIGVMVRLSGDEETGRDVAMHVAATNPHCISADEMPQELIEKEKQIFVAQANESGKPAEIIEKMVVGRINKFLKENTLMGQPFVKNPDVTVEGHLKQNNSSVSQFIRFEVGEGMEKKQDDFAAEVMAQAKGA
jgi:translation elongation factor Ts (EF-Ts)